MNKPDLDHKHLVSYYGEMVNETAEIFEAFLEDLPVELGLLKEEMNANSFLAAADRLHKISPSFSSVGIPSLTAMAKQAEECLRGNNSFAAKAILKKLNDSLNEFMPAIHAEYNRVKNHGTPA